MTSIQTIIRLLAATTITTISLATVVACGPVRTLENDIADIIRVLSSGVQGKTLTNNKDTQADALALFQTTALFINQYVVITLEKSNEASTHLTTGDNLIKVIATIKTITSHVFEANIIGVQ